MVKIWFNIIRATFVVGVLMLSFFTVIETIRAFNTLYELHPYAGYSFILIIFTITILLFFYIYKNISQLPKTLKPPQVDIDNTDSPKYLYQYIKYLQNYLIRLGNNPNVSAEKKQLINNALSENKMLLAMASNKTSLTELQKHIAQNELITIEPTLKELDDIARKQIRNATRDIIFAVTLSPYKTAVILIVIYRNLSMMLQIMRVYNARPGAFEQLLMLYDIINIIATINFINLSKSLIEGMFNNVPVVGSVIDDIAQGIGAGFMTNVAGHTTIERCRAHKKWSAEVTKNSIVSKTFKFYNDVKDIFFVDILNDFKARNGLVSEDVWKKIISIIDATGKNIVNIIKKPFQYIDYGTNKALLQSGDGSVPLNNNNGILEKLKIVLKLK